MKTYTIQPGQSNFRPLDIPWPRFGVRAFEVRAMFQPSCYYSLSEWEGDDDWYDWNKLKGITEFWTPNNCRACMVAWRPDAKREWFQVAAYVNYPGTNVQVAHLGIIPAGVPFSVRVKMRGDEAVFEYDGDGIRKSIALAYRRPWVCREVGTWIGGADNEPGQYGGKATKYMELLADVKY